MRRRTVTIPREDFERGDLPRICVVTGQAADGLVDYRFRTTPRWTWILLPLGVIPFLIAAYMTTETTSGSLPVTDEVVERFHRRRGWMVGAVAAGVVAIVAAAATATPEFAWLGAALLLAAGLQRAFTWWGFVTARRGADRDRVRLSRVHPRFATAVERGHRDQGT